MVIYFYYALFLGVFLSFITLCGCWTGNRKWILFGMIYAAIIGSPITSFTRGAAGAIYASDMVSAVLLFGMLFKGTQAVICKFHPKWYTYFKYLLLVAAVSTIFIAPFFVGKLEQTGSAENVRGILGLPLPFLMGVFRISKILLYFPYFWYACHLLVDEDIWNYVTKHILLAITLLAFCQIIDTFSIRDMTLYIPIKLLPTTVSEKNLPHIVGHVKASIGRIFLIGITLSVASFYKKLKSPFYLFTLCFITIALILSGSRAAFVGVFIMLLCILWYGNVSHKAWAFFLLFFILAIFIFFAQTESNFLESTYRSITNPSQEGRWPIWSWVLRYIFFHPYIFVTGLGFSNFSYAVAGTGFVNEHAHNDFLTSLFELGIFGLIPFAAYVVSLFWNLRNQVHAQKGISHWRNICMVSGFVGIVATSFFEMTIYYSSHTICMQRLFIILFGAATAQWYQLTHENEVLAYNEYEFEDECCETVSDT